MRQRLVATLCATIIIALTLTSMVKVSSKDARNVLFILVDDLRPQLGAYGQTQMVTPNIDALAADGTIFERAYVQQAVCAPSRASIFTGLRPDSTGIYDLDTRVREALPHVRTMPQHFMEHGYEAISIGKVYHHGDDDRQSWTRSPFRRPGNHMNRGYQTAEAQAIAERYSYGPAYEAADVPDHAYIDGQSTDHAIDVLRDLRSQDAPFFMVLGYFRPHIPFRAPKKYWDLYSTEDIRLSPVPSEPEGMPPFSLTPWNGLRRWFGMPKGNDPMPSDEAINLIHGYYASVSYVDAQVGRILDELERLNLADDTVVIFAGDHGWKLGDHGGWTKQTNFEIDTRAPLIIRVPGRSTVSDESGTRIDALVEFVDLYPTIVDLAGLPIPAHVEGESLVPLLETPDREWKPYAMSQFPRRPATGGTQFVHLDEYGLTYDMLGEGVMGYTLRADRYRYVEWFAVSGDNLYPLEPFLGIDVPHLELYDYEQDPLGNVNVVDHADYRSVADQLATALRQRLGDKFGTAWFESPVRGEVLDGTTPVQVGFAGDDIHHLEIQVNGRLYYGGASLPSSLVLDPSQLPVGTHELVLTVRDKDGNADEQRSHFVVEHVRIDSAAFGESATGTVRVQLQPLVSADAIDKVEIGLVPKWGDGDGQPVVLYAGASVPDHIDLDTVALADGAYDLNVQIRTTAGVESVTQRRIFIDNWNTIDDPILPPEDAGWFGTVERMKSESRSGGWQFIGDRSNTLFEDADRIVRGQDGLASIVWRVSNLHSFAFSVYVPVDNFAVQTAAVEGAVREAISLAASEDGALWQDVPYSMDLIDLTQVGSGAAWGRVQLAGTVPPAIRGSLLRFEVRGRFDPNQELQLGHAVITGRRNSEWR